jgi:hypothetical protein
MPDCDLDRSGTFCLLNPPTREQKRLGMIPPGTQLSSSSSHALMFWSANFFEISGTAGLSSLVAQKHNDSLASIRSSSDYDPRLSRDGLWRLLFRSTLLELYFSRVWAFQKRPLAL